MINVAIIGGGGREHALAYLVGRSKQAGEIYVIPGNGGSAQSFKNINISLHPPYEELIAFLQRAKIDLVIVGPEQYLCAGLVDAVEAMGIHAFGPNKEAAQLECSKVFAKRVMNEAGVPTPSYAVFTAKERSAAEAYLKKQPPPYVLKANGLCAGKGVIIANNMEEAITALDAYWEDKLFGPAAEQVLIEAFLEGPELSMIAISDGETIKTFPFSQDHKRLLDNNQGPNTGGMGVYTPIPFINNDLVTQLEQTIILPIIKTMRTRNTPFKGILYAGLIKDKKEGYQVLEFNVRLGDPESQCILPLFTGDALEVIMAACQKKLAALPESAFQFKTTAAVTVVLASKGYPQHYETDYAITGLEDITHSLVFHAGTRYDPSTKTLYTSGGRVLALTAIAPTLAAAHQLVYEDIKKVQFTGMYYRTDIGRAGF
ncbi:phosphoribosylamine--glycine ligase [Spirochaetota bacterium]|nr:phosphoribosylamine--glycine ligase [Spirochaetota bacterium]